MAEKIDIEDFLTKGGMVKQAFGVEAIIDVAKAIYEVCYLQEFAPDQFTPETHKFKRSDASWEKAEVQHKNWCLAQAWAAMIAYNKHIDAGTDGTYFHTREPEPEVKPN